MATRTTRTRKANPDTNVQEDTMTHAADDTSTTTAELDTDVTPTFTEAEDLTEDDEVDLDVEEPDADQEDVEEVAAEEKAETQKVGEKPKRGDLPEGWVTPIQFAKILGEKGLHTDRDGNVVKEVKPQMVYSYMKNSPQSDRLQTTEVTDSNGNKRAALKVEDAIAWWERKNARAATRKSNAAAKATKADNAGKVDDQALVETGEADPSILEPAEEAE
jgi:hypothetical protein